MRSALLIVFLTLAGCDSGSVTTSDVRSGDASNAPARSVQVTGPRAAESRGERVSGFPTSFQGRWAMTEADCRGDAAAKGLMTIDDKTVRFYESRGVSAGLTTDSATKVTGLFTFDGEGQRWRKEEGFELASGGDTLVRTESDPAQSFTYKRCK